jgi:Family of unknown function (DUF6502)
MSGAGAESEAVPLKVAMSLLEPVAGVLLTRQVQYAEAAEVLKTAFVHASARAFIAQGKIPSVSTLSVATGIGRVEVKRLLDLPLTEMVRKTPPAGRVRLRWLTDPVYLDEHGRPKRLPRVAPEGQVSFATLAATATLDTHPRAVLDELLRLNMVVDEGDFVTLRPNTAESPGADDRLLEGAGNASDHASALLVNLLHSPPPLLERAISADNLTKTSAARAVEAARDVWTKMLAELREKLQTLVNLDAQASDNDWRMKIGVYSYMAPIERSAPPVNARENSKRSRSTPGAASKRTGKRQLQVRTTGMPVK